MVYSIINFKYYDFGHHFSCVVPEYSLGDEYRVDYLLIGKNSIGYQFVFVEFEDVNVDYKNKTSNSETEKVRKGLTQIRDWRRWIDQNKSYFEDREGIAEFGRNIPSMVKSIKNWSKICRHRVTGFIACFGHTFAMLRVQSYRLQSMQNRRMLFI